MNADTLTTLRQFVLDRLTEDEERAAKHELPLLDEAERRGRLTILRADEGGLLLVGGPADPQNENEANIPFAEKAASLREELTTTEDEPTLRLLAAAYDTHHGWQEEWRD